MYYCRWFTNRLLCRHGQRISKKIGIFLLITSFLVTVFILFQQRDAIQQKFNYWVYSKYHGERSNLVTGWRQHGPEFGSAPSTRTNIWPGSDETGDRLLDQLKFKDFRNITKNVTKMILRVGSFNFYTWLEGQQRFIIDKCPVSQCVLTSNYSYARSADALVISEFSKRDRKRYLPKPAHQIWIVQHMESPNYNRIDPNALRGLVNWTASYRRDSTIHFPYYKYSKVERSFYRNFAPPSIVNYASGRTKKVVWVATNCYAHNGRLSFVRELSKYIDVDVYGGCGKLKCPHGGIECFSSLKKDYKFYLAFENSNCRDYISEKIVVNALRNEMLPVVMGAHPDDYAAFAPPRSYIHVDDFPGPHELAAYLHQLDQNDTAYNEYFKWKGTMDVIDQQYWCRMCMMLHLRDVDNYVHFYDDYATWWNGACYAATTKGHSWFSSWHTWRQPKFM